MNNNLEGIWRIWDVMAFMNIARSTVYLRVKQQLLTPPVKYGPRVAGWPQHEIKEIVYAYNSGQNEAEIEALVRQLIEDRQKIIKPLNE